MSAGLPMMTAPPNCICAEAGEISGDGAGADGDAPCVAPTGLMRYFDAFPPLPRWATLFRPWRDCFVQRLYTSFSK